MQRRDRIRNVLGVAHHREHDRMTDVDWSAEVKAGSGVGVITRGF
jgi:hypothetical protein